MYKLELTEKECEITLSNENHKICWDGRCYVIREKSMRKTKEGEDEIVYLPKYYFTNLNSLINKLMGMKLLTNKESKSLIEVVNELNKYKKEIVENLAKAIEGTIIKNKDEIVSED